MRVPRLSEFYGIVIYMYFADHNPPHFHAIYAEHEALIRIDNDASFAEVTIDPVAGTLSWPNGIDLDPDVLHGDHTSALALQPRVLREYRLQQTS